ncbi:MAG: DUF6599 family protein [Bacteroidales bacterium]
MQLNSQVPDGFPTLTTGDVPGMSGLRVRVFNGEALYGYINGGADLYIEYGFKTAVINELKIGSGNCKVEIYRMADPESAFGIFSVSRYKCRSKPDFARYTCLNRYQLQFCSSDFYVSIVNESGSKTDSINSVVLARKIRENISGKDFDLESSSLLNVKIPLNEDAVLVKGRLGLINGSPDNEDMFSGIRGFSAIILKRDTTNLIAVRLEKVGDLVRLGSNLNVVIPSSPGTITIAQGSVTTIDSLRVIIEKRISQVP